MADLEKQWFVLQTLAGKEAKVKENIVNRLKVEEMQDYVGEILIPTEKVSEVKRGKKTTTTRKFFPSYLLINLHLYDTNKQLVTKSWSFIQDTPGIIRFLGDKRPIPLREDEVNSILNQIEEKKEKVKPKIAFETGESVKINDGPFTGMTGPVVEVDPERGKLTVSITIFGRETLVELEYWQVERAESA
ncbi:MAG: transcription termination/antitermination protein NusG [Kiritimatiellae bacterium]|nr:transcription termination/antitermination protein NusG [Kiritimatiellia bacterium]